MVKIISNGEVIALAEEARYIRLKKESGAYVHCKEDKAQGLVAFGTPYNLPGHEEITQIVIKDEETGETERVVAPEAYAMQVDGGEIAFRQEGKISEVDETALTSLMATTDLYEELLNKGVL